VRAFHSYTEGEPSCRYGVRCSSLAIRDNERPLSILQNLEEILRSPLDSIERHVRAYFQSKSSDEVVTKKHVVGLVRILHELLTPPHICSRPIRCVGHAFDAGTSYSRHDVQDLLPTYINVRREPCSRSTRGDTEQQGTSSALFLESVTNLLAVYTSLLLSLVQELATRPDNCRALVCFGCTHYTMVPLAAS
jgi:hypothetical protein